MIGTRASGALSTMVLLGLAFAVALPTTPAGAADPGVERTIHVPEGWEGAYEFGYAPVVRVGDMVIVSGIPASGDGDYPEKIRGMYRRAEELLGSAGATFDDVVELTTFHTAPRDSAAFREELDLYMPIHRELFGEHRPAWTAVGTTVLLSPSAPVEMRLVAVVGSGKASRVVRGGAEADSGSGAAEADSPLLTTERFDFFSDPELNLHYFLYQWAAAEKPPIRGRWAVPVAEIQELDGLPEEERAAWRRALDYYREEIAERSPVFNPGLGELRDHFTGVAPAPASELVRSTEEVLEPLLPFYRRHWWLEHDADNRRFLDGLKPLLLEVEEGFGARMAEVFGGSWPEGRVRIDLSAYANDLGAYSTDNAAGTGPHVVMSTRDRSYHGAAGVEMVFHETGHWEELIGALRPAFWDAVETAGAEDVPRDATHAVLFYTAGELAREAFAGAGMEDYRPYAEPDLWQRASRWAPIRDALDAHWKPYLAGEAARDEALAAVARALAERGSG